jgi:enterochelin esterase-like enzyme
VPQFARHGRLSEKGKRMKFSRNMMTVLAAAWLAAGFAFSQQAPAPTGMGAANYKSTEQYEKANDAALKKAAAALKFVYYAYGREDFVARNTDQLKGTLNKYGIKVTLHETGGGHTWINWRQYLNDFAPRLFK